MDDKTFVQEYAYAYAHADNEDFPDVKGKITIQFCGEPEEEEFSRGVIVIDIIGE